MKINNVSGPAETPPGRQAPDNDPVATQALRDAERLTPAFSEGLHARIMCAVLATLGGAAHDPPETRWRTWRLTPVAAAATVLLAVGSAWYARRAAPLRHEAEGRSLQNPAAAMHPELPPESGPTVAAVPAVPVPSLQVAVQQVSEQEAALEADMGPGQWAGLDHDARVAVRLVLGPLPVKPKAVDEWGR